MPFALTNMYFIRSTAPTDLTERLVIGVPIPSAAGLSALTSGLSTRAIRLSQRGAKNSMKEAIRPSRISTTSTSSVSTRWPVMVE
jgi:hypothetical protein